MRAKMVRQPRVTATQIEILRMFHAGETTMIIRKRGPRQMCRIVPAGMDEQWRERHKNRPVQEHSLAALVKIDALVRTEENGWIIWRLSNARYSGG